MESSFKNKNVLVIGFEIFLVLLGVVGITFATSRLLSSSTETTIKTGMYEVDYKGNLEVTGDNLEPIDDKLININRTESVIRAEFSFRGTPQNEDDLIYDIILKDMNIDCNLLNEYTKWNLYKNGSLLSTGNFSPSFDSNVKSENLRLTNIQEDLPKSSEAYDNYVLIIWISESCPDLTTCKFIDQSNIIGTTLSMKAFVAVYTGEKQELVRVSNSDLTCANAPVLESYMVPVYYKEGSWFIADKLNGKDNTWYNYSNSMWANAVITNNDDYLEMAPGTKIENNDIVGSFVWIPRYKYKTWNIEDTITDSYDAENKGIDIVFEPGLTKSGQEEKTNNIFMNHPAFDNNRGFWISKYEISEEENIKFIENVKPLLNKDISEYEEKINEFNTKYKLTSNIINNLEWGAVAYLSHSKYGLCKNNTCKNIESSEEELTGKNKYDSTTRNVYGVYDMAGSAQEYVIGQYKLGSATTEIMKSDDTSWDSAMNTTTNNDYLLRGGFGSSIYQYNSFGMNDYTTRIVIK